MRTDRAQNDEVDVGEWDRAAVRRGAGRSIDCGAGAQREDQGSLDAGAAEGDWIRSQALSHVTASLTPRFFEPVRWRRQLREFFLFQQSVE
jgi:hypothetical protein